MTNEERIKKIEELGIKSDKMGLIPLDFYEIFKEHTYKCIDQAVASLEKKENQEKLVSMVRETDIEAIYAKILVDIINNCKDFHTKELLIDIFNEKHNYSAYIYDFDDSLNYQGASLDYIVQYIDKPLGEIAERYKIYAEIFKEEKDIFAKRWEEAKDKAEEFEDDEADKSLEQDDYDENKWQDREYELTHVIDDIACFKPPYYKEYDQDENEVFENGTKALDACCEIDKLLNDNFEQLMKITSKDFEGLVEAMAETKEFKNASKYMRRKAMSEVIKEAIKYNVKATKNVKNNKNFEYTTIVESDLDEIKEKVKVK